MTDDLVERLQPRWATDEEITRAAAKRDNGMRQIVTDFLVANNALKSEAADAILKLQGEVAEARSSAEAARKNFHTMQGAANELRTRLEAAEAEVARMREALTEISCPTQSLNLLWWQERARDALQSLQPGERT